MMTMDSNIEAWLNTTTTQQSYLVEPQVKAGQDMTLRYELQLKKSGSSGKSVLQQGGTVTISSRQSVALGSLRVSRKADDVCTLTLTLYQNRTKVGDYRFDCFEDAPVARFKGGVS